MKPARLPFRHSRARRKASTGRVVVHAAPRVDTIEPVKSLPRSGAGSRPRPASASRGGAEVRVGLLESFENGVERAVNTAFAKVFRSELKPVELVSALRREMDDQAAAFDR
ncbi:MAG: DUF3662 domain-containing protein, partial [Actinobacteria bacterium]|nr:DUF3662 domain-containing protein [Actinomycetota bacterium]